MPAVSVGVPISGQNLTTSGLPGPALTLPAILVGAPSVSSNEMYRRNREDRPKTKLDGEGHNPWFQ
jgi:hypothetical protein